MIDGLGVDEARMRENLELTHGALFSQRVLLALISDAGCARDDAYRIAQELAQRAWAERTPLREPLARGPAHGDARPRRDLRRRRLHTSRAGDPRAARGDRAELAAAALKLRAKHAATPLNAGCDRVTLCVARTARVH